MSKVKFVKANHQMMKWLHDQLYLNPIRSQNGETERSHQSLRLHVSRLLNQYLNRHSHKVISLNMHNIALQKILML